MSKPLSAKDNTGDAEKSKSVMRRSDRVLLNVFVFCMKMLLSYLFLSYLFLSSMAPSKIRTLLIIEMTFNTYSNFDIILHII